MPGLYPQGHKSDYTLPLKEDKAYMSVSEFTCPVCGVPFRSIKIRDVKLIPLSTDEELRVRYKDIEPLYYEVASCPNCRYSAQTSVFDKLILSHRKLVREAITPHLAELSEMKSETPDTNGVFERYFLALLCAEAGFSDHQMIEAGLWLKISRLYADAKDPELEMYAARESQRLYIDAFQKIRISPAKFPQLFLLIGMLSVKIGDIRNAREFLYKVKVDPNSTRVQKDKADDFINTIKEQEEEKQ